MTAQNNSHRHEQPVTTGKIGYRPYWMVLVSVVVRAVHQVAAAVFLTSFLLVEVLGPPAAYMAMALVSGMMLLLTEGMRHRQLYREVAGVSTMIKLVLLGAAYHQYLPQGATVLAAFLLASVAAHLPKELRHRLVY